MLRDPEKAQELTQEFAVRFLQGGFRNADPGKGRFRDFLKTALRHLAFKHWERQRKEKDRGPQPLPQDPGLPDPACGPGDDSAFLGAWQEELLAQAWQALERHERETGTPCYTVMRLKTQQPELDSAQIGQLVAPRLGKALSADAVRQAIKRARDRFADLLLEEVKRSLGEPSFEQLQQELIDLQLHDYCKQALDRQRPG
jgi:hypothetical protein